MFEISWEIFLIIYFISCFFLGMAVIKVLSK